MYLLRSKPLLSVILFLAVVLQGLIPFLHAHTGASSQIGLHMHVVDSGFESVAPDGGKRKLSSTTSGESPEVGVPASRQNDQFDFDLPDLLSLIFLTLPLIAVFVYQNRFGGRYVFTVHKAQAQNSLPPALAPPDHL